MAKCMGNTHMKSPAGNYKATDTNITITSPSRPACFPGGMTANLLASDPALEALNLQSIAQAL